MILIYCQFFYKHLCNFFEGNFKELNDLNGLQFWGLAYITTAIWRAFQRHCQVWFECYFNTGI